MSDLPEMIFWLMFGGFILFFIFNIIRRGGLKGAMFNATIAQTFGEVQGSGPSLVNTKVKVHLLERNSERLVGLEFLATSFSSYEMMPITLSPTEAKKLVGVLEQAIAEA